MPPISRLLAALALALLLLTPAPARAAATIRVLSSEARPDFPRAIVFELAAESTDADITAIQLLYGATRTSDLTIFELAVTPGRHIEVSHTLDTQVNSFPPGTDLTYRWVISDAAGNELTSEPQQVRYEDDRFEWSELQARNVTVLWYRGGADFGQELLATATRTLDRLEAQVGAELNLPVRIYIYADTGDMRGALEANSEQWIGGQAHPELGIIIGAIAPGDTAEVQRIIPHEISHQVLHQATDNPYGGVPVWFDEGLAQINEETPDRTSADLVDAAARDGRLIPLEALGSSFPADPDQAYLSYAQSRLVVAYILTTYGETKLSALVAAFAIATPLDEALPAVIGRSVDELDADWRATLPPQVSEPPVVAGPDTAPPDRFEADPPPDPVGQPVITGPLGGLATMPGWAGIAAMAFCCLAGVGTAGAALLVGLRLIGVDKRVS